MEWLVLNRHLPRDDNHESGPRFWPVKDCRGTVSGRGFLGPQICGPRGMGLCGTESFAGWAETGHARLHGPAFFFFISYFT